MSDTSSIPPVVRTRGLSKRYGEVTVVDDLDLEVPAGGIYGFLGPNGAGKSTSMKMILGLVRPLSGTVAIQGRDLRECRAQVLPRIGSMIEGPAYYPHLTGRENLLLVADSLGAPHAQVEACLRTVELHQHGAKLARHYSMGMKQRLGIAMALLGEPFLLMLDEPTNGLDPSGVVEMRELIIDLARDRGITVVVSSHILSEVEQLADTVGIIQAGRLRYQGTLAGLREEGSTVVRCSAPEAAREILAAAGWAATRRGAEVRTGVLPDPEVAALVRELTCRGHDVYRVELRRRSLEEAFLRLTDPVHERAAA